ncbi:uncharacterized protein LOC121730699 [Aricia agestis]|uniref:uncharacterized protein LOC121730699 n=1 Tax=Aricia agestis TaxID=91739 RepID=UPI001C204103|nr:uncharacterized protein LOC121730699 [Aricia agestis]
MVSICFGKLNSIKQQHHICPREETNIGASVVWPESSPGSNITSEPACFHDAHVVRRSCVDTQWMPPATELSPCEDTQNNNSATCPPSFYEISKNIDDFCYQISPSSSWDYPCLKNGGAAVITEFEDEDVDDLLASLKRQNVSRYFWLPGRRAGIFSSMTWYVSGPNWGRNVESKNKLKISTSIFKNCLLLDIQEQIIIADFCSVKYPSLCFYVNDIYYPARCPENYYAVRYMKDTGVCLGIERSESSLRFDEFQAEKCKTAMGNTDNSELIRFIYKKIGEENKLADNEWCWFSRTISVYQTNQSSTENSTEISYIPISINNAGMLNVMNSSAMLPCMACKSEVNYDTTELIFEYNENENAMYLTIYHPSGLWKYDAYDTGIQCFSDASGTVRVIDMTDIPELTNENSKLSSNVEKATYRISPVTSSPAQYWCEGHSKNFSFISTEKIVVNPKYGEIYVFTLVLELYIAICDVQHQLESEIYTLSNNLEQVFVGSQALIMELLGYSDELLMVLVHLHVPVEESFKFNDTSFLNLYKQLLYLAQTDLQKYNYTFRNLTSSMYCLPTTTRDQLMTLDWEATPIGQIAAPKQFCLQENGLPVKRLCGGSYRLGGKWGKVEGACDMTYSPSSATTFLYNFVKGQVPEQYIINFITSGLRYVLNDINIIIPADIYYLAVSLQHFLRLSENNGTSMDTGSIGNIAWAMNRLMVLNNNYLRLAQTLNSTNIILDTISNIIELITVKHLKAGRHCNKYYDYAVEPQFIIQVTYPKINNISGIAVIQNSGSKDFEDVEIIPLYQNASLEDILSIENLEIAAWLPNSVIRSLLKNTNESNEESEKDTDLHVIINIFYNDAMFQELNPNKFIVNSRIIGISIPGYIPNLKHPISLIFKDIQYTTDAKLCGYWEFHPDYKIDTPGHWSNRGCYYKYTKNNLTVCDCYHLTNFGQLLFLRQSLPNNNFNSRSESHNRNLNIISLVGSFLSLLGIFVIYITATLFNKWRQKAGTKVLLNLSGAIALPLIFMVIFNLGNKAFRPPSDENGSQKIFIACITLGALLHYSVLASFMWMLITAVLQFIRYVRVLGVRRPSRFVMKFTLIGWGMPTIPVIVTLTLDKENYIPSNLPDNICYPTGLYLIFGIVVPISLILIVNVILYVLVMWSISRGPDGKVRSVDMDLIGAQFRLSVFLFFLLGLTWIFGLFSFSNNSMWSYLFCLTSTLQGFVLFLYFIICDPETRNLWLSLMTRSRSNSKSRESITSISSG